MAKKNKKLIWLILYILSIISIGSCTSSSTDQGKVALVRSMMLPFHITSLAWRPNSNDVAVAGNLHKNIEIHDVNVGKKIYELSTEAGSVGALTYSADGSILAIGRLFVSKIKGKVQVNLFNARTGKLIQNVALPKKQWSHSYNATAIAISPDNHYLAVNGYDQGTIVELFSIVTGKFVRLLKSDVSRNRHINAIKFSNDGAQLIVGRHGADLEVWNTKTWKLVKKINIHNTTVNSLALYGKNNYVVTGHRGIGVPQTDDFPKPVRFYKLPNLEYIKDYSSHVYGVVRTLNYGNKGKYVYIGGGDKAIEIWDVSTDMLVQRVDGFPFTAYIEPDQSSGLFVTGSGKELRLWEIKNNTPETSSE